MSVIKAIEFPDREFSSKEELFKALKENKDKIIDLKKAEIRKSDSVRMVPIKSDSTIGKANDFEEGFIYPVINTTKYLDSHNDVHMDGIWDKSLKDQKGKVYYVVNHQLEVGKVIAYPKDVEMSVRDIEWKLLGANYTGKTQALIFKIDKDKIRLQEAKDIINEKIDIEHSVRMQYVKMNLALSSEDEDFKEEKLNFENNIDKIVNREKAESQGYFWSVDEAKIHKEGSMVLEGSNDVTPMLYAKNIQPLDSTDKTEPLDSTRKRLHY